MVFTIEELRAAAAATGLDVTAFRMMHVFHDRYGSDHSVDKNNQDPKAVAHMQPLISDALERRDLALARSNVWHRAKHQGWQVLDQDGAPVPEPAEVGENW